MRRTTWFLAGTAAGAYLMTKARRASEGLTYDGLTDRLAGLFAGARVLGDEIGSAAAEKEAELRDRFALRNNEAHALTLPEDDPEPLGALGPRPDERGTD